MSGKRVAVILSGGNIDTAVLRTVLEGRTPAA
jgi:threonine dehydratase